MPNEPTQRERVTRERFSSQRGAPSAPPPERQQELSEALACATAENVQLRAEANAQRAEANAQREENTRLGTELRLLREKVDALVRKLFGAQSESSGARQPKGGAFARRAAPEGAGKSWIPPNCC